MGNYHARSLGGWARATAPGYPPERPARPKYFLLNYEIWPLARILFFKRYAELQPAMVRWDA
jgi:hypothetical protein